MTIRVIERKLWEEVKDEPNAVLIHEADHLCAMASLREGDVSSSFVVNQPELWFPRRTLHGVWWWRCNGSRRRHDPICGMHAAIRDGFWAYGRPDASVRREMRARLNADRREPGTPARFYFRERFGQGRLT